MKLEEFKETFYQIFNLENNLDMEDIQCMWEALLIRNNIEIPNTWEAFIEKINSVASGKRKHFYEVFEDVLINPDHENYSAW